MLGFETISEAPISALVGSIISASFAFSPSASIDFYGAAIYSSAVNIQAESIFSPYAIISSFASYSFLPSSVLNTAGEAKVAGTFVIYADSAFFAAGQKRIPAKAETNFAGAPLAFALQGSNLTFSFSPGRVKSSL